MTKFELPEKPKKMNTSEDFNNLRKAVDELDKFDYTWKTYANKADRRINVANKHIEELERENQRLVAENLAVKTLVDSENQQQTLQVVPEFVAEYIEAAKEDCWTLLSAMDNPDLSSRFRDWFKGGNFSNQEIFAQAWINGYTVQKPKRFYLKNKLTTSYLVLDTKTGYYEHWQEPDNSILAKNRGYKTSFTQEEIDSMDAESYEKVEVEE